MSEIISHGYNLSPTLREILEKCDEYEHKDEFEFADWQRQCNTLAICIRLEALLSELQRIRMAVEK